MQNLYDPKSKAKAYAAATTHLGFVSATFSVLALMLAFWFQGFAWLDLFAQSISVKPWVQATVFFGILTLVSQVLSLPFQLYLSLSSKKNTGSIR